jgi:predicted nucleic acid-binding protein
MDKVQQQVYTRVDNTKNVPSSESENITELQESIIDQLLSNPEASNKEIAGRINCSESYVSKIRNGYGNKIVSNISITAGFADPYKIHCDEKFLDWLNISSGEVVKLSFDSETKVNSCHGEVIGFENLTEEYLLKELHGVLYGMYKTYEDLSDTELYGDVPCDDEGRLNVSNRQSFIESCRSVHKYTQNRIGNSDIIIGVGLLEILTDERRIDNLLETPLYKLEKNDFVQYLDGNLPELVDITRCSESKIEHPDEVYFAYYNEKFEEKTKERARDEITSQGVFHADWNYTLPGFQNLVGPTSPNSESQLVEVTKDNLNIVRGVNKKMRASSNSFEYDEIAERIDSAKLEMLGDEEELPTRNLEDRNMILFLFDPVIISLEIQDDHLNWVYPENIPVVENFINKLSRDLAFRYDAEIKSVEKEQPQGIAFPETNDIVFDTNAVYHQIVKDEPSSILHTVFSHRDFYKSNIHIPWVVLYEINKHSDWEEMEEEVKQGKENLHLLKILDRLDIISLEVEEAPRNIAAKMEKSDIADMFFMSYTSSNSGVLITGDKDLMDIMNISEIDVRDIFSLAELEEFSKPELGKGIISKIGNTLHEKEDIRDEIVTQVKKQRAQEVDTNAEVDVEPENHLERWEREDKIIPYSTESDDKLKYARTHNKDVVLSQSSPETIVEYINEINGNKYLSKEFFDEIDSFYGGDTYPRLKFHVPVSSIVEKSTQDGESPSDENINLYKIQDLKNADYEPSSPQGNKLTSNDVDEAVKIAVENDYDLIVGPDEDYIRRLAGLFDVGVYVLDTTEEQS